MAGNLDRTCEVCGADGLVNWLIPCKSCSTRGRHIYCLQNTKVRDPELVFDKDLVCGDCKSRANQSRANHTTEGGTGGDVGAQANDSVQGADDNETKGSATGKNHRQKKKKRTAAVAALEQQGLLLINGPTTADAVGSKAAATAQGSSRGGAGDASDADALITLIPGSNQGGIGNAAITAGVASTEFAANTAAGAAPASATPAPVAAAAMAVINVQVIAPQCPHSSSVFASHEVQEVMHEVNGDEDDDKEEMTDGHGVIPMSSGSNTADTHVEGEAVGSQQQQLQQHQATVPDTTDTGAADDDYNDSRPSKRSRLEVAEVASSLGQQILTTSMAVGSKGRACASLASLTKQFQHQLRGEGRHVKFVDSIPAAHTTHTRKDANSSEQQPAPAGTAGKSSVRPTHKDKASGAKQQQRRQRQMVSVAAHQAVKTSIAGRPPTAAPPQQQRPVPIQQHAVRPAAMTMLGGQGSMTSTGGDTVPAAVGPSTAAVVQSRQVPPHSRPIAMRHSSLGGPCHILGGGAAAAGRGGQPGAQPGPRNIIHDCFGKSVVLPTKPLAGGSQKQLANGGDDSALVTLVSQSSQSAGGKLAAGIAGIAGGSTGSGASLQQLPPVGSRPSVCSTPAVVEEDSKRTPLWKGKGVLSFELEVPAAASTLARTQNVGKPKMMALILDSINPYVPHVSMAKFSEVLRDQAGSQAVSLSLVHTSEVKDMQEEIYETNEFYKVNEPCEACLFLDLSVSIGSAVDTFSSLLDKLEKSGSILAMELPFLSKEKLLECDPWLERLLLAARMGGNSRGGTYRLYFKRHRLPIIGSEDRGGRINDQDGLKDALLCLTGSRRHIHLMSLWDKTPAIDKGVKGILMKETEKQQTRMAKKVKFYRHKAQGDSDDPDEQGSSRRGHNKEVQKRESMEEKAKDILSILQKVMEEEDEEVEEEEWVVQQQDSQQVAPRHVTSSECMHVCIVAAKGGRGSDCGDNSNIGTLQTRKAETINGEGATPAPTAVVEVAAIAMEPATPALNAAVAMDTTTAAADDSRAASALELQAAIPIMKLAMGTSAAAYEVATTAIMEGADNSPLQLLAADVADAANAATDGLIHQQATADLDMLLQPAANNYGVVGQHPGATCATNYHLGQDVAAGSLLLPQQPASKADYKGHVFKQGSDSRHKSLHRMTAAAGDHMLHATTAADRHMPADTCLIPLSGPGLQPDADDSHRLQQPANAGDTNRGSATLSDVLVQPTAYTAAGDAAMKKLLETTLTVESSDQFAAQHGAAPCGVTLLPPSSVPDHVPSDNSTAAYTPFSSAGSHVPSGSWGGAGCLEDVRVSQQLVASSHAMAVGQQIQQPTFHFKLQEHLQGLHQQQQESLQDLRLSRGSSSDDMSIDSDVRDDATISMGTKASAGAAMKCSEGTEASAAAVAAAAQQPADNELCTLHHSSATEDLPTWRQLLTHSSLPLNGGSSAATSEGPLADDISIICPSSSEVMWTWRNLLDMDHGAAIPTLSCQQMQQEQRMCHQAHVTQVTEASQPSVADPSTGLDGSSSHCKWSQIRVPILQAATMDPEQSGQIGRQLRRQLPSLMSNLQSLPVMPLHGINFGLVASDGEALELQTTLDEAQSVLGFEWTRIPMDKAPELLSNIHVLLLSSAVMKKVSELRGVIMKSIAVHPIEVYRAHIVVPGLQWLAAKKLDLQQLGPEQAAVHPAAAEAVDNPSITAALSLLEAAGFATADDCQPLYPHRAVVLLDAQGFLDTPPQVLERLAGCLHAGSEIWGGQPCVLQMRAADVVEVQRSGSEEHLAVMNSLLAPDFGYMSGGWDSGSGGLHGSCDNSSSNGGALLKVLDAADESQAASVKVLKDAMRVMHRRRPGRFVVAAYSQQQAEGLHSSKCGSEDDDNYIRFGRKCKDVLAGTVMEVVAFLDLLLQ